MSSYDEELYQHAEEMAHILVDKQASLCFSTSDWERAVNSAVDEVLENENISAYEEELYESTREYAREKHGSTY